MAFDSFTFSIAFLIFFPIYCLLQRSVRARALALSVASLAYYATWNCRLLPLLIGCTLLNFTFGRKIAAASGRERSVWLGAAVSLNCLMLIFFKSAIFHFSTLFVPFGVSFFTFQGLGYLVDVSRGEIPAEESVLLFSTSMFFFPYLLSGPLFRTKQMLSQLKKADSVAFGKITSGLLLFSFGFFKKGVADVLGPYVDYAFSARGLHAPSELWMGSIANLGQIYFDLSGYTDMALGIALVLGFELPTNFDLPFISASPAEFWRRWHISLTSWVYDYVYLPAALFLRRRFDVGGAAAVLLAFVVMGLWHQINVRFLVYGIYNGLLIILFQFFLGSAAATRWVPRSLRVLLTFLALLPGVILFRVDSVNHALEIIGGMFGVGGRIEVFQNFPYSVAILGILISGALVALVPRIAYRAVESVSFAWCLSGFLLAFAVSLHAGDIPFIYMRF